MSRERNITNFRLQTPDKHAEAKDTLATKQDMPLLEIKIEKTRADIIKWMFLFWIGQMVSLVGILQLFFKR